MFMGKEVLRVRFKEKLHNLVDSLDDDKAEWLYRMVLGILGKAS